MTYNAAAKRATLKYIKDKTKRLEVRYTIREYEEVIAPGIAASGLPTATFIKQAVQEKIDRNKQNDK